MSMASTSSAAGDDQCRYRVALLAAARWAIASIVNPGMPWSASTSSAARSTRSRARSPRGIGARGVPFAPAPPEVDRPSIETIAYHYVSKRDRIDELEHMSSRRTHEMNAAISGLRIVIRIAFLIELALGLLFWSGNLVALVPVHELLGLL